MSLKGKLLENKKMRFFFHKARFLVKKNNIETCVRSDRLSNTSIIPLNYDEFLIAGEKGIRKHSMKSCYENFVSKENNSQDSFIEVSIN